MSIKKSLIALAATALALMGFASSAMAATDGVIRDVTNNAIIPANTVLHVVGFMKFNSSVGGVECHVTANIKATGFTGTTGHIEDFTVPDTSKCTLSGGLAQCKVTSDEVTNQPWHVTVTPTDLDVTGTIVIHKKFSGFLCPPESTLTFSTVTLTPVVTGTRTITGGASPGAMGADGVNPIAGVTLSATGKVDVLGEEINATVTGELELTNPGRCTWKIASS